MRKTLSVLMAACIAVTACAGCGKKEDRKPVEAKPLSAAAANPAKSFSPPLLDISDNPAFFNTTDIGAKAPEARDLDAVIRPVLKKAFKDARLVSDSKAPKTQPDGEVLENKMVYAVRQFMTPEDGKALHAGLEAAGFGPSPRLGSKPTIWRGGAAMSLFKSTGRRSYSLVIKMDTNKQQITVESYKLGSKYDRLM